MAHQPVAGATGNLWRLTFEFLHRQITNVMTSDTNEVGVRVRLVPIVSIAIASKTQLQHFSHLFQCGNRFVNRGYAGCWKFSVDLMVDLFHTGMTLTKSQDLEDGHALRGYSVVPFLQSLNEFVQPGLWIRHCKKAVLCSEWFDEPISYGSFRCLSTGKR